MGIKATDPPEDSTRVPKDVKVDPHGIWKEQTSDSHGSEFEHPNGKIVETKPETPSHPPKPDGRNPEATGFWN